METLLNEILDYYKKEMCKTSEKCCSKMLYITQL